MALTHFLTGYKVDFKSIEKQHNNFDLNPYDFIKNRLCDLKAKDIERKCNCDIQTLMIKGCQCGGK